MFFIAFNIFYKFGARFSLFWLLFYHHFAMSAVEMECQVDISLSQGEGCNEVFALGSLQAGAEVVTNAVSSTHQFAFARTRQLKCRGTLFYTMLVVEGIGQGVGNIGAIVHLGSEPLRVAFLLLATVGAVSQTASTVEPFDGLASPCR